MKQRSRVSKPASEPALLLAIFMLLAVGAPGIARAAPESSAPAVASRWDPWIQIADPLATVGAVIVAFFTVWWSVRSWKLTFFTKEWSTLIQFLHANSDCMERERTEKYTENFTGPDRRRYELVARLCIGYLDDLYFLGSKRKLRTWFRGSVALFGGTHEKWLKDNRPAYDDRFFTFIMGELHPDTRKNWWQRLEARALAGPPFRWM